MQKSIRRGWGAGDREFCYTIFSSISGHRWCKEKLSANWRYTPFGKFFNIALNFENKAFFYILKRIVGLISGSQGHLRL